MTKLRFKVGELAIYSIAYTGATIRFVGMQFEIIRADVGSDSAGVPCDYEIESPCGWILGARDFQLRKINPSAEPATLTRECEEEITP